jgi:hypothetical protein
MTVGSESPWRGRVRAPVRAIPSCRIQTHVRAWLLGQRTALGEMDLPLDYGSELYGVKHIIEDFFETPHFQEGKGEGRK